LVAKIQDYFINISTPYNNDIS